MTRESTSTRRPLFVYVGRGDDTISVYRMNPETGELTAPRSIAAGRHPSFLAFTPSKRFVYAVNEFADQVAAFAVDPATGDLTLLGRIPSEGGIPAYVAVDHGERFVFVANYGGGTVAVFPILEGGRLGPPVDKKATGENPHAIRTDPSNRFVFVPNKGSDYIAQFAFDAARGTLTPSDPPRVSAPQGSEPRHFAFHPSEPVVYVIEELGCRVRAFAFDDRKGTLAPIDAIRSLPAGVEGPEHTGSDLHVSPSGKFLYGSNRGHDSIVIYAIGPAGKLELVGHASTEGQTPRNFGIDPTGRFLLAANQGSGTVVVFRIDEARGTLARIQKVEVGAAPYWVGAVALP